MAAAGDVGRLDLRRKVGVDIAPLGAALEADVGTVPDRSKETGTRRFRGIATVALTAPQDEAIIRLNPIGLYVQDFDWTAQL